MDENEECVGKANRSVTLLMCINPRFSSMYYFTFFLQNIAASIKEQDDKKLHSRNSSTASATSIEVANINSKAGGEDTVEKPDENKNINGKVSTGVGEHGFVSVPLGR